MPVKSSGSRIAFDLVAPIAERKGDEAKALVKKINAEFDKLQTLLDKYGSLEKGYILYDKVTAEQQKELTAQIDATRERSSWRCRSNGRTGAPGYHSRP